MALDEYRSGDVKSKQSTKVKVYFLPGIIQHSLNLVHGNITMTK